MIYKFKKEVVGSSIEVNGLKKSWAGDITAFVGFVTPTIYKVRIVKPGFSRSILPTDTVFINDVDVSANTPLAQSESLRDNVLMDAIGGGVAQVSNSFESHGILSTNTAAQNKVALQTAIDALSLAKGGVLYGSARYPIEGLVNIKNDVLLKGNADFSYKGSDRLATFIITNTTSSVFALFTNSGVTGFGFEYPNQNFVNPALFVQYPTTIINTEFYDNVKLTYLSFMGAWKAIYLDNGGDVEMDMVYGYPLGGTLLHLKTCLDIPRVTRCHVNPTVGRENHVPISGAVVDWITVNGSPTFIFESSDEFVLNTSFVFGGRTFLKAKDSYGSVSQCNADMVERGIEWENTDATRSLLISGFSGIPSAGVVANRAMIKASGVGSIKINGITGKLGSNPAAPNSSNANCNTYFDLTGGSAIILDAFGVTGYGYGDAVFQNEVIAPNSNIRIFGMQTNSPVKYSAVRNESSVIALFNTIKINKAVNIFGGTSAFSIYDNSGVERFVPLLNNSTIFSAEFLGAAGTTLAGYVPEFGTIASYIGSPTLDGSGGLSMAVTTDYFRITIPSTDNIRAGSRFIVGALDQPRMLFLGNVVFGAQLNVDIGGTTGTLHIIDFSIGVVSSSANVSLNSSTMMTVEIVGDVFTAKLDNAAATAITTSIAGKDFDAIQFDISNGSYVLQKAVVTNLSITSSATIIYTPASSVDTTYPIGTVTFDDNFQYFRTSSGVWEKVALSAF